MRKARASASGAPTTGGVGEKPALTVQRETSGFSSQCSTGCGADALQTCAYRLCHGCLNVFGKSPEMRRALHFAVWHPAAAQTAAGDFVRRIRTERSVASAMVKLEESYVP
jgi:hypothetical protein